MEAAVARKLSAATGIDGYAATLMVADAIAYGDTSAHYDTVQPYVQEVVNEMMQPFTDWLAAKAEECRQVIDTFVEALAPVAELLVKGIQEFRRTFPSLIRQTAKAHDPHQEKHPLCINGHEYSRRRKARGRRGR